MHEHIHTEMLTLMQHTHIDRFLCVFRANLYASGTENKTMNKKDTDEAAAAKTQLF